jgi:hypothetical protein
LHGETTLADDLGTIGESVGPRTGPNRRSAGEKEDYVLRRLLAAWKISGRLRFPVDVRAERTRKGEPDFVLRWSEGRTLGVEITEAGDEDYQRWLTRTEDMTAPGSAVELPFEPSMRGTISELAKAIAGKIAKFDSGAYQRIPCHLVVYDNTAWGALLDRRELVAGIRARNDLGGRFEQIHLVSGAQVWLDVFGEPRLVDLRRSYEIDVPNWAADQAQKLRSGPIAGLDTDNIAGELEDLGKSERRAFAAHLRTLLVHLLKYQFQPRKRSASWLASIGNARAEIEEILTESPSLRSEWQNLQRHYARARGQAARETALPLETFPDSCPYAPEQLVDDGYLPGERQARP